MRKSENLNNEVVTEILNKKLSFGQKSQVAFFNMKSKTMVYFPRFWVVNNEKQYRDLMHYICNIDMIVHPQVVSFPQTYELVNNKNFPELNPIND